MTTNTKGGTMPDNDDERDDERDDQRDDERERERERPATLDAAHERIEALERELAETRAESVKRRQRVRTLESELAGEREKSMDDQQREVEKAKRETREELEAEHRKERVRTAVLLASATKLRDPADALRHLDVDSLADVEDGELQTAAARAVDKLVEDKDYLAAGSDVERQDGAASPGPRQRQAPSTRRESADMNARIRRRLRR